MNNSNLHDLPTLQESNLDSKSNLKFYRVDDIANGKIGILQKDLSFLTYILETLKYDELAKKCKSLSIFAKLHTIRLNILMNPILKDMKLQEFYNSSKIYTQFKNNIEWAFNNTNNNNTNPQIYLEENLDIQSVNFLTKRDNPIIQTYNNNIKVFITIFEDENGILWIVAINLEGLDGFITFPDDLVEKNYVHNVFNKNLIKKEFTSSSASLISEIRIELVGAVNYSADIHYYDMKN